MIEQGIYYDLTSDDYHGDKDSISRSSLMDFKKSPYFYYSKHLNPDRPLEEPKAALEFGTAFHMLILEPELFEQTYIAKPEPLLLKDVGRENYDKYKTVVAYIEKSNKKILSIKDFENLRKMQDSLVANAKARELIQDGIYESSYFWIDEDSGVMLKARPDILHDNLYVDLKTCDDASPYAFQKSMANYGYHIQAAMVEDGIRILHPHKIGMFTSINICVEKKYPYSIGIYIIDEAAIDAGRQEYKQLCIDLASAKDHNKFPDYEPQTLGLPRWYV